MQSRSISCNFFKVNLFVLILNFSSTNVLALDQKKGTQKNNSLPPKSTGVVNKNSNNYSVSHSDFFALYSDPAELDIKYKNIFSVDYPSASGVTDRELDLKLELISPINQDLAVPFKMGYGVRTLDGLVDNDLYSVDFATGLEYFLTKNFLIKGSINPTFRSDFKDYSLSDVEILGDLKAIYRINPATILYFGGVRSQDFDDYQTIPVLGIRTISEDGKTRLNLELPRHLEITYNLAPRLKIYSNLKLEGKLYELENDKNLYIQHRTINGGVEWWVFEQLAFNLELGYLLGGEFEFANSSSSISDSAPLFSLGLKGDF